MDVATIDKRRVIECLRARVEGARLTLVDSQKATQADAIHEETRAEDPKDTRSTEASYLARGLAQRVLQLERAAMLLASLDPRPLEDDDSIGVSALVGLESEDGDMSLAFVVPAGGGEKLEVDGVAIRPVTPGSPLGAALLGRTTGDDVEVELPGGRQSWTVRWLR